MFSKPRPRWELYGIMLVLLLCTFLTGLEGLTSVAVVIGLGIVAAAVAYVYLTYFPRADFLIYSLAASFGLYFFGLALNLLITGRPGAISLMGCLISLAALYVVWILRPLPTDLPPLDQEQKK